MSRHADDRERSETSAPSLRPELVARICWYHFHDGQTQQQVAERVGLSRATINKVINDARRQGIVRISIDSPAAPCAELEERLRDKFSLRDVVVVPSPADEDNVRHIVGIAAGEYISKILRQDEILALGWGGTVFAAAQSLAPRRNSGISVVSLSGGLPRSAVINPYDNAASFAKILDAQCYYMTAPMYADDEATKKALMRSSAIRTVVEKAASADIALLTTIDLTPKTWIIKHGAITREMLKSLIAAGAVGGVCDQYVDADGRVIDHELNRRTVAVPLGTIRKIPHLVLCAGGFFKVPIIRAALSAQLAHTLITDEQAAGGLLAS
ncbi:sugar-binding transcriptional regulator [Hyphomicrobium sp. CS1BSMeth3]|uniref:sugar-binding transcriptional regulator n=1 Tax=Hyphomicrobium sp. CS1BSMeth3 TaxID=1892844 RepID=UPI000931BF44|nr:sugar-binding transcriptional regulator [Hyphomicrobium sp. CS1BSMeth3]